MMKLFVLLAIFVIAANAKCTIDFEYKCSADEDCDTIATTTTWKVCSSGQGLTCESGKCKKKPVVGETCAVSSDCFDDDFEWNLCINSVCTGSYYKAGGATCTLSSECISRSCIGGTCSQTAAGSICIDSTYCTGTNFCQSSSLTSTTTCSAIIAANAACYRTSDVCAPGHTCTGTGTSAGTCAPYWSIAKGAQCSQNYQCSDGLWCDAVITSGTYRQCIDPPAEAGECQLLVGCGTNYACDADDCKCKGAKENKDSDVVSKVTTFEECLDGKNCKAQYATTGGCGADCLSQAKDVNSALDHGSSFISRGWVFSNTDPCDSASVVSVSFIFVAVMALFAL